MFDSAKMTKINFDIPETLCSKIIVYDILGNEVATVLNEKPGGGEHEIDFRRLGLPEGTYFCKLILEGFTKTKKITIIK